MLKTLRLDNDSQNILELLKLLDKTYTTLQKVLYMFGVLEKAIMSLQMLQSLYAKYNADFDKFANCVLSKLTSSLTFFEKCNVVDVSVVMYLDCWSLSNNSSSPPILQQLPFRCNQLETNVENILIFYGAHDTNNTLNFVRCHVLATKYFNSLTALDLKLKKLRPTQMFEAQSLTKEAETLKNNLFFICLKNREVGFNYYEFMIKTTQVSDSIGLQFAGLQSFAR
jgi:hypothetical protein